MIAPASIGPIDWAVIGTGKLPGVNAGTAPSAAITPAKTATRDRSRAERRRADRAEVMDRIVASYPQAGHPFVTQVTVGFQPVD